MGLMGPHRRAARHSLRRRGVPVDIFGGRGAALLTARHANRHFIDEASRSAEKRGATGDPDPADPVGRPPLQLPLSGTGTGTGTGTLMGGLGIRGQALVMSYPLFRTDTRGAH